MSELANDVAGNSVKPRIRGTIRLGLKKPVEAAPVVPEPEPLSAPVEVEPLSARVPVPLQHRVVFARMPGSVDPLLDQPHPWSFLANGSVVFEGPLWLLKADVARQLWCRIVIGCGLKAKRHLRRFRVDVLQVDQSWRLSLGFRKSAALVLRVVPSDEIGRRFFETLPETCPPRLVRRARTAISGRR